jgi:aspartyl-tRNA(Asn)/glutamyl-tRNA(Gln) amidotransferase subunit B
MVELAVKAGLALHCRIASRTKFDRKNYFYADTPKNYQISQYDMPIAEDGFLELPSSGKRISIRRAHLEEDSAKMFHTPALTSSDSATTGSDFAGTETAHSLVDHNRAGVPLLEIVTGPDMESGSEAAAFGEELQRILRYAGISDCNMQDGSLRVDVNISIRPQVVHQDGSQSSLGTKVELKNLNSFSAIERAVDHEILRQAMVLDQGGVVRQETRLWDEREQATRLLRIKEGASDYRYFPEPDIPLLVLEPAQIEACRATLPELPAEKRHRYMDKLGLSSYDAGILTDDPATATYFERTVDYLSEHLPETPRIVDRAKAAANWIAGDITAFVKQDPKLASVMETALTPKLLAELILLIEDGTISGKIAKELVPTLMKEPCTSVRVLVEAQGRTQIRDEDTIKELIRQVMRESPQNVQAYRQGKTKLAGFFVGQVMKRGNGRLDPALTQRLVSELLAADDHPVL